MPDQQAVSELTAQFRALGDLIHAGADTSAAMARIVQLATQFIEGCDWAAITRVDRLPRTLAATHGVARAADALQASAQDGPCLTAARDNVPVRTDDLAAEQRWPVFVSRALEKTPVRAALAFPLDAGDTCSALNLYAGRADAFTAESISMASVFAAQAQLAVLHLNAAQKSVHLEEALTSSRQIGTAMGILMVRHKITEDEAFTMLRKSSQHLNRKLRDIAVEVSETGALPDGQTSSLRFLAR